MLTNEERYLDSRRLPEIWGCWPNICFRGTLEYFKLIPLCQHHQESFNAIKSCQCLMPRSHCAGSQSWRVWFSSIEQRFRRSLLPYYITVLYSPWTMRTPSLKQDRMTAFEISASSLCVANTSGMPLFLFWKMRDWGPRYRLIVWSSQRRQDIVQRSLQ